MPIDNRLSVDVSRALNEPLYGTIKASDVYFLLEYNDSFTNKAWEDAAIPQAVKDKLQAYPNSHQLLIRQPGQSGETDKQITLFVIHTNSESPQSYRLNLTNYDAILEVDFDAVLRGEVVEAFDKPMYAVCTNGKRDICCSKFGMVLYTALTAVAGDDVWQVSHIGGHRFAGTMYCFPHALCYGFLTEADAPQIVQSYSEGRLLLNKLRGRGIMNTVSQVADYFLRRELNEDRINAVCVQGVDEGEGQWTVCLDVEATSYRVQIAKAAPMFVLSTTGDEQYKPVPQFKFLGYEMA
jgi:hypothetical protein